MHPVLPISIGIAALGAGLAAWSLRFADRDRGARRCPKCWYSMASIETRRCPECGFHASDEASLRRTRPNARGMTAGIGLVLLSIGGAAWFTAFGPGRSPPPWTRELVLKSGRYEFAVFRDNRGSAPNLRRVRVRWGGRDVLALYATYPELGAGAADGTRIGLADDINGDGVPDFVVRDQPGNGLASQTTLVFSLEADGVGAPVSSLGPGTFADLNADGVYEFIAADCSFAYRWTSGAGSPYPEVILRWDDAGRRYIVALDLMRRPPPEESLLAGIADHANAPSGDLSSARIAPVLAAGLELIYSGNEDRAWTLIDASWERMADWPLGRFRAELREALAASPYAAEIRALQALPPPADP